MIHDTHMLGGKNLHEIIENAIGDIYENLSIKIDKTNYDRDPRNRSIRLKICIL